MWELIKKKLISKRFWGLLLAVAIWAATAFVGGWKLATDSPMMIFQGGVFAAFMTAEGWERSAEKRAKNDSN